MCQKKSSCKCELDLTNQDKADEQKFIIDIFKSVSDHFRNDINAVWQRNQFFLLSNLGLLGFFYSNAFDRRNLESVLGISMAGIITSLCWLVLALVTAKWICVWRKALVDVEKQMVPYGPYQRGEKVEIQFYRIFKLEKFHLIFEPKNFHLIFRPEIIAIAVAFIFVAGWCFILIGSYRHLWN